jgi:bifunctional non-homologous end joining protein LigD
METKKFQQLSRQDYGLFPAKICFKPQKLFRQFKGLETAQCPFANLPEARAGRWGQGLTAEKMSECKWLRPGTGRAV